MDAEIQRQFTLTLDKHGGDVARECTLTLRIAENNGVAFVSCKTDTASSATATEHLPPAEVTDFLSLTVRSRLDEGGHIGYIDASGVTETLTFRAANGRTAVLLISGNKNFVIDPARQSLLGRLRVVEDRLAIRAFAAHRSMQRPKR